MRRPTLAVPPMTAGVHTTAHFPYSRRNSVQQHQQEHVPRPPSRSERLLHNTLMRDELELNAIPSLPLRSLNSQQRASHSFDSGCDDDIDEESWAYEPVPVSPTHDWVWVSPERRARQDEEYRACTSITATAIPRAGYESHSKPTQSPMERQLHAHAHHHPALTRHQLQISIEKSLSLVIRCPL